MVSVIFTVLNEGRSIRTLLDTLAQQTRPPDEVVVCDGGSRDDTLAQLNAESARGRMNLRVVQEPGANISRGRNVAISAAKGPIIACCDAGVRLENNWLEQLTRPFDEARTQAVAGFFHADPINPFELAMSATVLPLLNEIDPEKFLPSSRSVAFTKSAWQAAGGYPEWLDYCEDLIFDLAIKGKAGGFTFAPAAIAHFRPRGSLRSFFKQYFLYARGDGKAGLFLKRHLIRYATYLLALPALLLGWLMGYWPCALLLLMGAAVYLKQPYLRLRHLPGWSTVTASEKLKILLLIPLIRVVGDAAKMTGYPAGLLWKARRDRPKN